MQNSSLAPVVLFVYNRPDHTRQTVEHLLNNHLSIETDLIIHSDGPKSESEVQNVQKVRAYLKTIHGFRSIQINERKSNYGLAKNIIEGVSQTINGFGKAIVVEDDLITSPYFLQYMNEALNFYNLEESVACIHGYVYPLAQNFIEPFFLKGADCWGWGTWKRAWDLFESDGQTLLDQIVKKNLEKEFDFNNSYPYLQMLKDQIAGLNNSWAIRWYASAFLRNKLVLYPPHSLVKNIGNDSTGTHSETTDQFDVELYQSKMSVKAPVQVNAKAYQAFANYFMSLKPPQKSFSQTIKKIFKQILK